MLGQFFSKTGMRGKKMSREKWEKSNCRRLSIVLRKAGKTVVAYLTDVIGQVTEYIVLWAMGERSVWVTLIHSWTWRFRTGDWGVFSRWHEQRSSSGPRVERYVAEKLGTSGVHVVLQEAEWEACSCACFSFQLSFVLFPRLIFLIQCVPIKLTCVLKQWFATWWVLIAITLFKINVQ